jgi:hypothetical protein
MSIERAMEYAIQLANPQSRNEFEDNFKLASLIEEIAELQRRGILASSDLNARFSEAIKNAYASSGPLRQEIELRPSAKRLVSGIK